MIINPFIGNCTHSMDSNIHTTFIPFFDHGTYVTREWNRIARLQKMLTPMVLSFSLRNVAITVDTGLLVDIGNHYRNPSGKHTKSYWKWPFIVSFPIIVTSRASGIWCAPVRTGSHRFARILFAHTDIHTCLPVFVFFFRRWTWQATWPALARSDDPWIKRVRRHHHRYSWTITVTSEQWYLSKEP